MNSIVGLPSSIQKVCAMKHLLILAVLILSFTSVLAQQSDIVLEVGAKLKKKHIPKRNLNLYMTHPSQLRPYIERKINGVNYVIAFDQKSREIKYISTHDTNFLSANGLKVGSYIENLIENLYVYPGWEIRAPKLADGWLPIVGFNGEVTTSIEGKDVSTNVKKIDAGRNIKVKVTGFVKGSN